MNSDDELMFELKHRPKLTAGLIAKELKINGKLPLFETYAEPLAKYGKGFS